MPSFALFAQLPLLPLFIYKGSRHYFRRDAASLWSSAMRAAKASGLAPSSIILQQMLRASGSKSICSRFAISWISTNKPSSGSRREYLWAPFQRGRFPPECDWPSAEMKSAVRHMGPKNYIHYERLSCVLGF